jgi:hypothetical protein
MLQAWLAALGNQQIDSLGAGEFHIGARRVEVRVIGNHVALFAHHAEEDALGGASLVRGNHVLVSKDVLNGILESIEAAAARVAFVAFHDGRPLVRGHGAGPRVGEQIDQHVVGMQQEKIVVRSFEKFFALGARRPANGLDTLDPKRLDDGLGDHDELT